jgi:reactive intermediate/imine deaminase
MQREAISTPHAPAAIGTYSQAIRSGDSVYISGQIPLIPGSTTIATGIEAQVRQVFSNLSAICTAAGAELDQVVKFTVYLTDLGHFAIVNQVMASLLHPPYPARAVVEVRALPKDALVEVDAILSLIRPAP